MATTMLSKSKWGSLCVDCHEDGRSSVAIAYCYFLC
jgi:hypothetical protein